MILVFFYIHKFMEMIIKLIIIMMQAQNWKILYLLTKNIFCSVPARKLKCLSLPRLGSEPFQLDLAQLGKFQLELITSTDRSAKPAIYQTHPPSCWLNIRMVPSFTQNFESSSTAHCRYRDSRMTTTGWIMRHLRHKNHSVGKKQFAHFFSNFEFVKLLATYI